MIVGSSCNVINIMNLKNMDEDKEFLLRAVEMPVRESIMEEDLER